MKNLFFAIFALIALSGCTHLSLKDKTLSEYAGTSWKKECTRASPRNYFDEVVYFYQSEGELFYRTTTSWYSDEVCRKPVRIDMTDRKIISQAGEANGYLVTGKVVSDVSRAPALESADWYTRSTQCGISKWNAAIEEVDVSPTACAYTPESLDIHLAFAGSTLKWSSEDGEAVLHEY